MRSLGKADTGAHDAPNTIHGAGTGLGSASVVAAWATNASTVSESPKICFRRTGPRKRFRSGFAGTPWRDNQ